MKREFGGGTGRSWHWLVGSEGDGMVQGDTEALAWTLDGRTLHCNGKHRGGGGLRRSVWDMLHLSIWVG